MTATPELIAHMTATPELIARVAAQLAHGKAHGMEAVAIDVADLERLIALAPKVAAPPSGGCGWCAKGFANDERGRHVGKCYKCGVGLVEVIRWFAEDGA